MTTKWSISVNFNAHIQNYSNTEHGFGIKCAKLKETEM
jgi:hypothetical protein